MTEKPAGTPGRKKLGEKKRVLAGYRLDPECKAWLDRQAGRDGISAGRVLDALIRSRMDSWLDHVP